MGDHVLKRGLSNVFIAELIFDTEEELKYGTPRHLMPAGEMSRTVENDKTNVYFDNVVFYQSGSEGATEISVTGAALRAGYLAEVLGKYVDPATGAVLDTGEYVEKYYALCGETDNTDGTHEYFWMLKGTFAPPEHEDKTKDDSTDTNGMTMVFSAIQTAHKFEINGEKKPMKRVVIDTGTSEILANQDWTKQVVTPENLATVVKKKEAAAT